MTNDFYTLEELRQKSLTMLQQIDIRSKQEEELVQQVILEKKRENPPHEVNVDLVPDIFTKEQEIEEQRKIDEKRAQLRREHGLEDEDEEVEIEEEDEEVIDEDEEEVDERTEEEVLAEIEALENEKSELESDEKESDETAPVEEPNA